MAVISGDVVSPVRALITSISNLDRRLRIVEKREFPVGTDGGGTPIPTEPVTFPALNTGWTQTPAPFNAAGYWKDRDTVHLQGTVSRSTFPAVVFTLPAGYRPAGTVVYSIPMYGTVEVLTTGDVNVRSASTYVSLDGVSFRAV